MCATPTPRWRTKPDGSLTCPHRDHSVCQPCFASHHGGLVELDGAVHFIPDPTERAAVLALLSERSSA